MKTIVVSAINIFEGGPLTILNECLLYLSESKTKEFKVIAFVHDKSLFSFKKIEFIELPKSRSNYLFRFYYEYVWFYFKSKSIKPYLWLSLHDMTPNVISEKRVVYCHNPSPFFRINFKQFWLEPRLGFFNLFYNLMYKINLNKNDYVIVQQCWIRDIFLKKYQFKNQILVSRPNVKVNSPLLEENVIKMNDDFVFFFPSFPRVFKNFECICESMIILNKLDLNSVLYLTITGNENKYSRWLYKKYGAIKNIKFIGKLSLDEVYDLYKKCDVVIFPSKLETWGLPISEAIAFNKNLIVSDLPYAHETANNYNNIIYFDPNSPEKLAAIMQNAINGNISFNQKSNFSDSQALYKNWEENFEKILS
jgi:glycosyltransferase involved in cell wall biosynthesis